MFYALFLLLFIPTFLSGAPYNREAPQQNLRHEISNLQAEVQVISEKMKTQEDIIETFKRELDSSKKTKQGNFDQKLSIHDSTIKGFAEDLRDLKNHSNKSLEESDTRIKELEKTVKKQSESIEHLKAALSTLIDGIKGQDEATSFALYEVKSGDSLGLIAQKNKVSIKLLKEINQLKSDAIFKGQKLKIPE